MFNAENVLDFGSSNNEVKDETIESNKILVMRTIIECYAKLITALESQISLRLESKEKTITRLQSRLEKSKEATTFYYNYMKLNDHVLAFFDMQLNH